MCKNARRSQKTMKSCLPSHPPQKENKKNQQNTNIPNQRNFLVFRVKSCQEMFFFFRYICWTQLESSFALETRQKRMLIKWGWRKTKSDWALFWAAFLFPTNFPVLLMDFIISGPEDESDSCCRFGHAHSRLFLEMWENHTCCLRQLIDQKYAELHIDT